MERDIFSLSNIQSEPAPTQEGEYYLIHDSCSPPPPPPPSEQPQVHPPGVRPWRLNRPLSLPSLSKESSPLISSNPRPTMAVKNVERMCLVGILLCSISIAFMSAYLDLPPPLPTYCRHGEKETKNPFPFIVMYLTLGFTIFLPLVLFPIEIS
jgi:hypothetical protein